VETYIRHPFSENDINTILFWHEDLHFSAELIVYLVEYVIVPFLLCICDYSTIIFQMEEEKHP
jgi:hypothetical protein